ncbi:biopolymer transporter ExbD [Exilibacterium tricleocarpae]|uniref:Biopolymer transporter ExbD n=1 Tax=Exilibacterium tricleocarpae TaxID=2591008 RepID=A0A545TVS7_9GAMM|nr:biopolymer transporter ExbD [Exilibacterium tricleocarpae]TQV81325.1 biopolymer transporter ExbD [Exilibacterium tricleocarpae]
MKFKRQLRTEEGVNLTPLIDVVFLLLIFFMVSTTFTKETHLNIDLPEANGELSVDDKQQIEILINADGSYAVNGQSLINKKLTTLMAALEETAAGKTDRPLIITADANSPHQAVVTAMDAAGQLGFVNLSITTINPKADT